jgi:predicted amidohydrolase YtcJ
MIITGMITSCGQSKQQADLLVVNARVYTVNDRFDTAEAFAVKDGKFVAVGTTEEITGKYTAGKVIDAQGKTVYPGFNDGHSHFLGYGLSKTMYADLVGTSSFYEVIDRVMKHRQLYSGEWILGRGWDQNDWQVEEFPTKEKLDEAFPDEPVVLRRIDGHALIANTEAINRAGVTAGDHVAGGEIVLKKGELTGVFIDNAMDLIDAATPPPSKDQKIKALQKAEKDCLAAGLTTVTDAGLPKEDILLIDSLQQAGVLHIRVYAMISPTEDNFEYFFKKGPYFTGKLTVSAVKLYIDGALGSRGALLLEPYSDDPDNYGLQLQPEKYYDQMCRRAYKAGFQVNTHAIGDSGNRIMLKTYARYLKGPNDRRWRIEHAQVVNRNDLHYFKDYNIIPSIQTTHCTSDMYWAEERLGPERVKTAYAYHDLLQQNGWLINGTDFPVEGISPLRTFYAAVARKDLKGWPEDGFQMENALTRQEALHSVTIWPAKGSFEEDFKGSVEPGKAADFVILDKDIMEIPEEEIPEVKVLVTYLGGISCTVEGN